MNNRWSLIGTIASSTNEVHQNTNIKYRAKGRTWRTQSVTFYVSDKDVNVLYSLRTHNVVMTNQFSHF
jgi:hypothetical protein